MTKRSVEFVYLVALLFVFGAAPAHAQLMEGTIDGTVKIYWRCGRERESHHPECRNRILG